MNKYFQLISDLIHLVDKFHQKTKKSTFSLESFILWLNREVFFKKLPPVSYPHNETKRLNLPDVYFPEKTHKKNEYLAIRANVQLTLLIHTLSKHLKHYSKKVLYDTDLVSMDGHTFLSMLNHIESIRKMELIKANYSEVSSGIEVIKRLLRKGFIEEFDDPNDKRSKRVKITNKGKMEYEKTLPDLRKVLDIMAGNLSDEKKIQLNVLLDELNDFHLLHYEKLKGMSLDQLLAECNKKSNKP